MRNIVHIAHWNAGNAKWEKKITELEALLQDKLPDVIFISEANLFATLPDYQRKVEGYSMHIPESMMKKHAYVRLVMLVREGIEIEVHHELMHEDVSMIWASLKYSERKKMKIGGVYREHQLLMHPKPNPTLHDDAQLRRWNIIIRSWKLAAKKSMCTVIGDMNLDYLRWGAPEKKHIRMVDRTREEIETIGFTQVLKGHTRSWPGQADSMVDHCWLNKPQRLISSTNEDRSSSDHNYTSVFLRTKDKINQSQESHRRVWKFFDPERFRAKIATIDWSAFYQCEDINIINDYFEN